MAKQYYRNKDTEQVRGIKATDVTYNEISGSVKILGPGLGVLEHKGVLSNNSEFISFQPGQLVAFYNSSSTTQYIIISDSTITNTPDITNAIALKPNDYTILTIAPNAKYIRCSVGNTVASYLILDESYLTTG